MLIFLEGPDGAGKTTLANQLQQQIPGLGYVHHGPYPGVQGQELAQIFAGSMKPALQGQSLVIDRCWISEPIYSSVFRKTAPRISPVHRRMLDRQALSVWGCVVLCLPSFETCVKAFTSGRDEMLKDTTQLKAVYDRYELPLDTDLPVIHYDFTK